MPGGGVGRVFNPPGGRWNARGDVMLNDELVTAGHFPVKFARRTRCRQCIKSGLRREPCYGCAKCAVPLCFACFMAYHSEHYPDLCPQIENVDSVSIKN